MTLTMDLMMKREKGMITGQSLKKNKIQVWTKKIIVFGLKKWNECSNKIDEEMKIVV